MKYIIWIIKIMKKNKDGNNPNKIWNDYKNGKIKIK